MKISVVVKPNSKNESVERAADGSYTVRVNALPVEGRANERVRELLAAHFKVAKCCVALLAGTKSKRKTFELREK